MTERAWAAALALLLSIGSTLGSAAAPAAPPAPASAASLAREEFNRLAVRLDLPVFWIADADGDDAPDPAEIAALLFYDGQAPRWTQDGGFTPAFEAARARIAQAASDPSVLLPPGLAPAERERREQVGRNLDYGRPTLLRSDFRAASAEDKAFVRAMLEVAARVDVLYARQLGLASLAARVPVDDPMSRRLFRRNQGPGCEGPPSVRGPACSAIPGAPVPRVGIYPESLQAAPDFCARLEARADAAALLAPFVAVRERDGALVPVPFHEAWPEETAAVAGALRAAAATLGAGESAQKRYLEAAARGFETDDWWPADEAWAAIRPADSKWYVRAAPDESYWDPCGHKAGYALTVARINPASLAWQRRLGPVLQDMEQAIAERAGAPYRARRVAVQLPDFIDIVLNAGNARFALGGAIGQSLPNSGPVASESRGRTMVMTNLGGDPDSRAMRRAAAASLLDAQSLAGYSDDAEPELLSTILHELMHNLGPAQGYTVDGRTDDLVFGGALAGVLEELKAQDGASFLLGWLGARGLITPGEIERTHVENVVWCFGHIAQGMYAPGGEPEAYSQLCAIELGVLLERGALRWQPQAPSASGAERGAFSIRLAGFAAAADALMAQSAGIKARGDTAAANRLVERYVRGDVVPQAVIAERWLRQPKASYVYAVEL